MPINPSDAHLAGEMIRPLFSQREAVRSLLHAWAAACGNPCKHTPEKLSTAACGVFCTGCHMIIVGSERRPNG